MIQAAHLTAIDHIILACGNLRHGERAVILCDDRTRDLAETFRTRLDGKTTDISVLEAPYSPTHGTEPPAAIAEAMAKAHLIFGLTSTSKAHTAARRTACLAGARYLSLPEYSWDLLLDPSILADYKTRAPIVRRVADIFTQGRRVRVTSALGTDITLDITGREGNACPGFVDRPGMLGSPPDIEANVSPVEDASEGIVVIDGSIPCPEVGLLSAPITLRFEKGKIVDFSGPDRDTIAIVKKLFADVGSDKAYVLAECGVGLNDMAKMTGIMLTDEGAAGCMHFGIGSNSTVGGKNSVPFHLDFVFRNPSLYVDDRPVLIHGNIAL